jgi:transcriptional regulator with XRE-family HTH domain
LFVNYQIVRNHKIAHRFRMNLIRVTGSQIAAGRALASLSREALATQAGLSYHSIRAWERSSNSIPEATYSHLCRAIEALEARGIRFIDGGVCLQRPASVLHSNEEVSHA